MAIYNVLSHVIALVEADNEDEAVRKLERFLDDIPELTVYNSPPDYVSNAFESEPVAPLDLLR